MRNVYSARPGGGLLSPGYTLEYVIFIFKQSQDVSPTPASTCIFVIFSECRRVSIACGIRQDHAKT